MHVNIVNDSAMRRFVSSPVSFEYFTNLVGYARELCLNMQSQLDIARYDSSQYRKRGRVSFISYCSNIVVIKMKP